MPNISTLLSEFITLWVVIDPIGTLPVFIGATASLPAKYARKVAFRAVLIAFCILLAFILLGQIILEALGLGLPSFQIAGGLVLFLFALTMIFGDGKPSQEAAQVEKPLKDKKAQAKRAAVFPLAMPSIASPGAMLAVVMLTDNDRFSIAHQAMTASIMFIVLFITLLILVAAQPILRVLGETGAAIVSRVMGMVLAAVAVDTVLKGFVAIGVIPAF
ncbi:MarC family protein [Celeribacter litoreus]|uniref:MarC family protein n=1 Tax=Celeribacter litoreus TaxID=2876714 RepID=UPI001CCB77C2|nr:MarC family protein [Celeribacter litoreus]MCA0044555.1 MarC family protein [Celeribacter litoreus]